MKKAIGFIFLILTMSFIIFYIWGSASNMESKDYSSILSYSNTSDTIKKDTFSICTYNIGYLSGMTNNLPIESNQSFYNHNLTKAKHLLTTLGADIIGFQEIDYRSARSFYVDQMSELAISANYKYGAKAINWDKKYVPFPYWPPSMQFGEILSGQGILSKYPISNNEITILEKPESNPFYYNAFYLDRLAQVTQIQLNETSLIVINVHLEAFVQETREKHAQAVLKLYLQYAQNYPVLLIGDFNSTPPFASNGYENDRTTHFIFDEPSIGVAIAENQYLLNEIENFTYSSLNPTKKIDYIFYNKNKILPIQSRVIHEASDISDHLPIWFKFTFK
ncbi:MAG: endonuclease/exonuclease/phosphatase family protein [Cyclobacteriaceae bacterium]|nr:endonuclease/exonuclease/phosphatase family protein [Cyclobacteriaceae bacterium]